MPLAVVIPPDGRIQMVLLFRLCSDAYESAKLLCEQYYLGAPELELRQMNGEAHMR